MTATWEHRQGDELTRQAYLDAGDGAGIARAVEVSAETAYRGLTEDQQAIAREVFRRLTGTGPDRRPALRAVSPSDLRSGRPAAQWPQISAVLEAFARHRLVALDSDRAEIAHDVLLQAWPRLRGWLAEDETSMILHGQLAEDTARWRASGGDRALLYRDVQLAAAGQAARVWAGDPGRYPPLGTGEAEFLRASGRAAARGRRRRQALAGLLAVVVVAALAGAGVAVKDARTSAARQGTANTAQGLAAQSTALDATDPVTAALLAGAAWRLDPTAQARYSLLQSLAQPVRGILTAPSGVVTALAYSPDGGTLAAGYSGGTIRLWDLASHRTIRVTTFGAAPLALAFAGGGSCSRPRTPAPSAPGTWPPRPGSAARPLSSPAQGRAVAFSPDGATVATGGADGNVRLWNTATGQEIGAPMSSDANPVDAVAFSPDGALVASASTDGNVQLWSTASQQVAGPALIPNGPEVDALAFSPDGKLLATGGQDGTARLWNVGSGEPGRRGHGDRQRGERPDVRHRRDHAGHGGKRWRHRAVGRRHPGPDRGPAGRRGLSRGRARWPSARARTPWPPGTATGTSSCGTRRPSTSPPSRWPSGRSARPPRSAPGAACSPPATGTGPSGCGTSRPGGWSAARCPAPAP